jgi:hypothetical protein
MSFTRGGEPETVSAPSRRSHRRQWQPRTTPHDGPAPQPAVVGRPQTDHRPQGCRPADPHHDDGTHCGEEPTGLSRLKIAITTSASSLGIPRAAPSRDISLHRTRFAPIPPPSPVRLHNRLPPERSTPGGPLAAMWASVGTPWPPERSACVRRTGAAGQSR